MINVTINEIYAIILVSHSLYNLVLVKCLTTVSLLNISKINATIAIAI